MGYLFCKSSRRGGRGSIGVIKKDGADLSLVAVIDQLNRIAGSAIESARSHSQFLLRSKLGYGESYDSTFQGVYFDESERTLKSLYVVLYKLKDYARLDFTKKVETWLKSPDGVSAAQTLRANGIRNLRSPSFTFDVILHIDVNSTKEVDWAKANEAVLRGYEIRRAAPGDWQETLKIAEKMDAEFDEALAEFNRRARLHDDSYGRLTKIATQKWGENVAARRRCQGRFVGSMAEPYARLMDAASAIEEDFRKAARQLTELPSDLPGPIVRSGLNPFFEGIASEIFGDNIRVNGIEEQDIDVSDILAEV